MNAVASAAASAGNIVAATIVEVRTKTEAEAATASAANPAAASVSERKIGFD